MIGQVVNLKSSIVKKRFSKFYDYDLNSFEGHEFGFEIRYLSLNEIELLTRNFSSQYFLLKKTDRILFLFETAAKLSNLSKLFVNHGFNNLAADIQNYLVYDEFEFTFAGLKSSSAKPLIMGILNLTNDSFYDGGKYNDIASAIEHAHKLIQDGADIIDIGGESTRPYSDPVPIKTELQRTIPVIEKLIYDNPNAVISIDTTKPEVAEAALSSGAKIINDISGGTFDQKIWEVAAKYNASYILMHIQGNPKTMQQNPQYKEVISDIFDHLKSQTEAALSKGINEIAIDPGIGFGKRIVDNFEILLRLEEFKSFGIPILIGLSNKSFLGKSLKLDIDEREIPTVIAEVNAVTKGARIIRTHNVKNLFEGLNTLKFINNPFTALNV